MTLTEFLLLMSTLSLVSIMFSVTHIRDVKDDIKDIKQCLDTIKRNEAHTMNCVEDIKNDLKDE